MLLHSPTGPTFPSTSLTPSTLDQYSAQIVVVVCYRRRPHLLLLLLLNMLAVFPPLGNARHEVLPSGGPHTHATCHIMSISSPGNLEAPHRLACLSTCHVVLHFKVMVISSHITSRGKHIDGYHLLQNNYSFDAFQAYCFGINLKL